MRLAEEMQRLTHESVEDLVCNHYTPCLAKAGGPCGVFSYQSLLLELQLLTC